MKSKKESTRKWSKKPALFTEDRQPEDDYLILPVVSSENRPYLPMMYVTRDVIANANAQMLPHASLYEFGVLSSKLHTVWMRAVCGRLETRIAYSVQIVYNNFPWPEPTDKQRKAIEKSAKEILRVREKYGECLADLYGEKFDVIYQDLQEAHLENDRQVMRAYGFNLSLTEEELLAKLFTLYEQRISDLQNQEN